MGIAEQREAFVEAFNMAGAYLLGYVAARSDGNRTHLIQNVQVVKDVFTEDLCEGSPEAGARTEAFLVCVGDYVQALCEQIGGWTPPVRSMFFEPRAERLGLESMRLPMRRRQCRSRGGIVRNVQVAEGPCSRRSHT